MAKAKIISSSRVKPFICDLSYSSKMLLDESVAGTEVININQGILKVGGKTGGATHEQNEIYYVLEGEARLRLGEDVHEIRSGDLVFIPGGVFHALENTSPTDDFILLTFWERAMDNEVWHLRMNAWGKSFAWNEPKTIDEE